jgi:hypothetical protein
MIPLLVDLSQLEPRDSVPRINLDRSREGLLRLIGPIAGDRFQALVVGSVRLLGGQQRGGADGHTMLRIHPAQNDEAVETIQWHRVGAVPG